MMNNLLVFIIFFVSVIAYCIFPSLESSRIDEFVFLVANISSALAGLLFMSLSILIGMNNPLIHNLKRFGHFRRLLSSMFWLIICFFIILILSASRLVVFDEHKHIFNRLIFVFFAASSVFFGVVAHRFYLVLKVSAKPND